MNMEREKDKKKKVDSFAVCYRKTSTLAHSSHTLADGFHVQRNAPAAFEDRRHCIHSFVLPQSTTTLTHYTCCIQPTSLWNAFYAPVSFYF